MKTLEHETIAFRSAHFKSRIGNAAVGFTLVEVRAILSPFCAYYYGELAVTDLNLLNRRECWRINQLGFVRDALKRPQASLLPSDDTIRQNTIDYSSAMVVEHGAEGLCSFFSFSGCCLELKDLRLASLNQGSEYFNANQFEFFHLRHSIGGDEDQIKSFRCVSRH